MASTMLSLRYDSSYSNVSDDQIEQSLMMKASFKIEM